MNIKKKIAAAIVSGSVIGAVILPSAALADTSCEISGNGAFSHNSCRITIRHSKRIRQSNSSSSTNRVKIWISTGGNDANGNTGGRGEGNSGDGTADVTITNEVNQNN